MTIAAREIIKEAGTCVLITLDDESIPMARIMDPFPPESDFTVWFGTKSESRKVDQIKNNPTVTLYYQDSDASGYVVIHGKAQIVDDEKEKEKRWKNAWEAFYPNNKEGYLLIKVSPEWMEILSYTRGIVGDPITWKTPTVTFDK
ncbi:pyridoxamine 5'-phosphate oxidase family protein [Aureitalea sp. L0-47]|uniref:pyridoxamine 5'-phosphate oxidase family protein n=1 Tax=Aureitalea sp. L0-47 TaxID=2816962 RepID=UPI002238BE6D|nr:pyridoxamine 5'-phosphate oxidase family protein [Aureitalea sp. L0-47]MCW5518776.1 pyridoxamine 5'-phosphate oxidase family protein [Aureitalea sp. L0-47]